MSHRLRIYIHTYITYLRIVDSVNVIMFARLYYLLFAIVLGSYYAQALNVLGVFEIPSKSVHILGHELMLGLLKRGHNVTLISSFPLETRTANYSHVYLEGLLEFKEKNYGHHTQGESKFGMFNMLNAQINLVDLGMKTKNFQQFLKSDSKFDIIIQTYALNEAYLGLAHRFNAPVIGYMPFSGFPHVDDVTGNTSPYSYVSIPFGGFTQNMSFFQRVANVMIGTLMRLLHRFYLFPSQEEIFQRNYPAAPPLRELQADKVDLFFINAHIANEFPRPKTPNIVYIGGYHIQKPEPLTHDLEKLMDQSKKGVIFVGFGTNVKVSLMPTEKLNILLNTFAKFPNHNILLKYEGVLANKPKNIRTEEWFPQRGILAHPNTKVFISHGGKSSLDESLYFGIPTLCVSFYGDQMKNCREMVEYGYGIHLPYQKLTQESFEKALTDLIEDPKYYENAKFRAALFKEQEMDPLDRANFWVEHIHKFKGGKHLQPKAARMPLYQYLLLDVILFLLFVLIVASFVCYKITKCLLRTICGRSGNERQKASKTKKRD